MDTTDKKKRTENALRIFQAPNILVVQNTFAIAIIAFSELHWQGEMTGKAVGSRDIMRADLPLVTQSNAQHLFRMI